MKELKLNENSVTNSHKLSNAFHDHFPTTGTKLANEVPLVTDGSSYADYIVSSDNKFIFSPISSSKVFSLLNKLSKSKATGLDNISVKLIRECADLILFEFVASFECKALTILTLKCTSHGYMYCPH